MRLTIKLKLAATFTVVVAMAAGGMFIAIDSLGKLDTSFTQAVDGNVKRIQMAADITARTLRVARDEKNMLLAPTSEEMIGYVSSIADNVASIDQTVDELRGLTTVEGTIKLEAFAGKWDEFVAIDKKVLDLATQNSIVEARKIAQTDGGLRE